MIRKHVFALAALVAASGCSPADETNGDGDSADQASTASAVKDTLWQTDDGKVAYQFRSPTTGGKILTAGKVFPFESYQALAPDDPRVVEFIEAEKLGIKPKDIEGMIATFDADGENLTAAFVGKGGECVFDPISADADDCLRKIGKVKVGTFDGQGWGRRVETPGGAGVSTLNFHYRFVSEEDGGVFSFTINGQKQDSFFSSYVVIQPEEGVVAGLLEGEKASDIENIDPDKVTRLVLTRDDKNKLFSILMQTGKNCLVELTNVGPECLTKGD